MNGIHFYILFNENLLDEEKNAGDDNTETKRSRSG